VAEETVAYEMPLARSLDIDTESDFVQLQSILGDPRDVSLSSTP
jgi:CMP-N-acetylneuraminic acid synthetase